MVVGRVALEEQALVFPRLQYLRTELMVYWIEFPFVKLD
jgi:hypothetical protein